MYFWGDYSLFLLKFLSVVIIVLIAIGLIAALAMKAKLQEKTGKLVINKLNDKFDEVIELIRTATLSKQALKQIKKEDKKKEKKEKAEKNPDKKRLFILNFCGDIKASNVTMLREEVTSVLLAKKSDDEVLVRLESAGGMVNAYGLAASQLQRLKDAKMKLTVAIDKVAASGGYLMACVADEVIAAPFAIIGSIGVIAQLPNFHRYLDKKDVDFEQVMSGQYKRTLSLFGKNTSEGRKKLQSEIDEIHELFKNYILNFRPQINIEKVATGEHWMGTRAFELQLVDKLMTSDDYLLSAQDKFNLFEVKYEIKKPLTKRLGSGIQAAVDKVLYTGSRAGQDY